MPLRTRLTEKLGIRHPVLLAPMGNVSGGMLAGAVSEAGGLGLLGGGYGDAAWLEKEFGGVHAIDRRLHSHVDWAAPETACKPTAEPASSVMNSRRLI